MTDNVLVTLEDLKKVKKMKSVYVFGYGKDEKPYRRWWISEVFRKSCKKVGIKDFRFHDLRHDFCSKLVQKGVDLYSVAALAGHRKIKISYCGFKFRSQFGHNGTK